MGAAWRRSKTRHEGMPTFGTFNMGGGARNRWDVVKNRYGKLDVLGLQEFSSSRGKWKGGAYRCVHACQTAAGRD